MNNEKIKYAGIGFVLGVAALWVVNLTFLNLNGTSMMGSNKTSQSNQMMSGATIDAHFIEQMIPHHEDAITMSNLALEKAQRPEVKTLAQNIIDSQTAEINQMKDWYEEWFEKKLPAGDSVMNQHGMMGGNNSMHMGMMGDESDENRLESADDFDRAYVEDMIPHHQMAVMMASMLKNGTDRPEMKKLAEDITTAQTKEIDQMREWLKSW